MPTPTWRRGKGDAGLLHAPEAKKINQKKKKLGKGGLGRQGGDYGRPARPPIFLRFPFPPRQRCGSSTRNMSCTWAGGPISWFAWFPKHRVHRCACFGALLLPAHVQPNMCARQAPCARVSLHDTCHLRSPREGWYTMVDGGGSGGGGGSIRTKEKDLRGEGVFGRNRRQLAHWGIGASHTHPAIRSSPPVNARLL